MSTSSQLPEPARPSHGKPRGRLAGCLPNLALLGVAVALTLTMAELALRFAAHHILPGGEWASTQSIFTIDETLGVALRPGATRLLVTGKAYTARDRINSLGMRGPVPRAEPAGGHRRVLVLGDSFVFGQGVPVQRSLPAVLQEMLDGAEVINAGIPGYTLGQEYLFYRERLRRLRADLVLVGFFMNDLDETRTMNVRRDEAGVPLEYRLRADAPFRKERARRPGPASRLSRWLRSRSLLYTLARDRLDNLRYSLSLEENGAEADDGTERPEPPTYMHIFRSEPPEETLVRWEHAWNTLSALQEMIEEDGGRMLVFYIPAEWQVSEKAMREWVSFYGRDPAAFSRRKPQEMLERWASRSGALFVDLLPHLEGLPRDEIYFPHDLHWTSRGHALAAQTLVEAILRAGLL